MDVGGRRVVNGQTHRPGIYLVNIVIVIITAASPHPVMILRLEVLRGGHLVPHPLAHLAVVSLLQVRRRRDRGC